MGAKMGVPPPPMPGDRRAVFTLTPYPPLPWVYRDPQRWLLPLLVLIAVVAAALVLG